VLVRLNFGRALDRSHLAQFSLVMSFRAKLHDSLRIML